MARAIKNHTEVLRRPLITEKTATVGSQANCVVFAVDRKANKLEIKRAVEKIFDVKVRQVRTVNSLNRAKRFGMRMGKPELTKKAYVYLAEGSSIDLVEGL